MSSGSSPPPKNRTSFISDSRRALPWYKIPHRSIPSSTMTSHLSTEERMELHQRMAQQARTKAIEAFGDRYAGYIPGSIIQTQDQADAIRALVACWTRGKWVPVTVPKQEPIKHFQDPLYGSCDNKFYKTHPRPPEEITNNTTTPWSSVNITPDMYRDAVKYVWQPACDLPVETVDPELWCRVLRGRNIALVGDLVHYQMHEILLDVLRDGPVVCYGEMSCKEHTICSKPKTTTLQYVRNDLLSPNRRVNKAQGHPSASIIDWPFVYGIVQKRNNIFIVNRAPVVEDDATFITQLIESMQVLRRTRPNALVIYRSTGIGHPYCNDAQGPLAAPLTDLERQELPYGWSEQTRRNAMAKEIVEAAGGLYLDLAALTDMRPDGHIGGQDCLRYCIPGPLDAWVQVLYNVMLGLEGQLPLPQESN
ncbi:hypothetical protein BDA99DRAFT_446149 [Phascolomyces articulosus]|uniref:Trichome birefringence-like C-terminal domain-containing protein n=1 Tax=Phascolomyces articulosus TaxID=60185 RepID=A0AAD5PAA1_9FUNG|nr:hypothetical protein BDA99DRAFT_446149 [Phascolomyces articulosus]